MTSDGPMRVTSIDIAFPLDDLDCARDSAPPYAGAWILVSRSGLLLGIVEIPLQDAQTIITATELERELRRQLGEAQQRDSPGTAATLPRATVVVPTNLARPAELRRCLERLQMLDYPDYEVIVVDNRPADAEVVDLTGARVIREPRPGASAARNRGFAEATGDIVAFTDDDAEVERGWLRALAERFVQDPGVAAVTGLVVPRELETPAQLWFEQSGRIPNRSAMPVTFERFRGFRVVRRGIEDDSESVRSIYATGELALGGNMAVRATVLRATGGFDEALGPGTPTCAGEDPALILQLLTRGYRLAYEPSAIVRHPHRATLKELERQIHDYGVGFTAMLTSTVLGDPRHLLGLTAAASQWLRSRRNRRSLMHASRDSDYRRVLARAEVLGMLAGPLAYLRSRWMQRQWAQ